MSEIRVLSGATQAEAERRLHFASLIRQSPIPPAELGMNLGLYLSRMQISRLLLMHKLYRLILPVHGVVMEFGVRWGQNLALFSNFRGMYEPYNYNRKLVGFDTFTGFPSVDLKDGHEVSEGDYGVGERYT